MSNKLIREGEPEFFKNNKIRSSLEEKRFPNKYYPGLEQGDELSIHKTPSSYGMSENPKFRGKNPETPISGLELDFKKQLEKFRMERLLAELSLRIGLTPLIKNAIEAGLTGPDIHKVADELIAQHYGLTKSKNDPLK